MARRSIVPKSDPKYYEEVGQYISRWLSQNKKDHQKPGTQKELCYVLERQHQINLTPAQLSRYINGINKMPAKIENAISNLGFKSDYFVKHHASSEDKLALDLLTKEDLYKLIHEQKLLLHEWKEIGFRAETRMNKLMDSNSELVRTSSKLVDENDKLRVQIRELRKESKNKESD
jgi:hypothetical protein